MNRINVTTFDEGEAIHKGWFDADKAKRYKEATDYNGRVHISRNTGSEFAHEELYRTREGRWVLGCYSNYQGTLPGYEYVIPSEARAWLTRNDHDKAVIEHFGEVESERGPAMEPTLPILQVIKRAEEFARTHGDTELAGELYALGCTLGSNA